MAICKYLNIFIFTLFFLTSANAKNRLQDITISAEDFIILKYELFLNKNIKRLYGGGGFVNPIVVYEFIDYQVEYTENGYFLISINAFMNKFRYSKEKKYIPKISDCNVVRNKIFLNKMGYKFLSYKRNYSFNEEDLNISLRKGVFNFPGLDEKIIDNTINNTKIIINVIHPKKKHSLSCEGRVNQVSLD